MKQDIEIRVLEEAEYILKEKQTVRAVAKIFNISKSTVHYDLSCRLKSINRSLFTRVNKLLKFNLSVRHIRGGEATKRRYKNAKKVDRKN